MIICTQEFNFSALDADDIERMEAAQKRLDQADAVERQRPKTGYADALRGQCRLIMGYLDEILGEGASQRLGLTGSNFKACVDVVNSFKAAIAAERADFQAATAQPMNREQRRAAEEAKCIQIDEYIHRKPVVTVQDYPDGSLSSSTASPDASAPDRVAKARRAVQAMMDDPEALQQLAEAALRIAEEHNG